MTRALCIFLLAACGRFGFGEQGGAVDASVDATDDAPALGRCGHRDTAPDPLHVRGVVFRYLSFDNDRSPLVGAMVTAYTTSGTVTATTGNDGTYDLALPTGGAAVDVYLGYTFGTDFTTYVYPDQSLDRDITGPNAEVLTIGDGPIWNAGQMSSIYSSAGLTRDATRGTLSIGVRDCMDLPIAGATIDIQPPPEAVIYQANDGRPLMGVLDTQTRYGQGFGMNAIAGPTTITITHPTHTFEPLAIDVLPGSYNQIVVARASD